MKGRKRCYMLGGAEGSGDQPGNHNALKHWRHTAEVVACRRELAALLRACRERLASMRDQYRTRALVARCGADQKSNEG